MFRRALALAPAAAIAVLAPLAAADGDLDPTFAGDGLLVWGTAATDPYPTHALLAPDGALVVVGLSSSSNPDGFDWRRLTDSGLDSQCGYDPPSTSFARAIGAVFDSHGRLIVVGRAQYASLGWVAAVARFQYPACTLDTTFDGDGYAIFDGSLDVYPAAVAFARWWNGATFVYRIVLAAYWESFNTHTVALISLRENGTPDPGFGTNGLSLGTWGSPVNSVSPVGLFAVGERLLLGVTVMTNGEGDFWAGAVHAETGVADLAWAAPFGYRQIDVDLGLGSDDRLQDMTFDRAGRLLLVGVSTTSNGAFASLARLDAAGDFDSTFDAEGRLMVPVATISIAATAATVDSAGRILIAGNTFTQGSPAAGAARLSDAGVLDTSYGAGGRALHPIDAYPETDDSAQVAAAVLWGGRTTLVGEVTRTGESRGFAARLDSALIFRDGFERGSTVGWPGF